MRSHGQQCATYRTRFDSGGISPIKVVGGKRTLQLTEFTLTRWLNSVPGKGEYRGPKLRDEYIDLAHALLQLQVISPAEAQQWLLSQGLYPLPHEAIIFGPLTTPA